MQFVWKTGSMEKGMAELIFRRSADRVTPARPRGLRRRLHSCAATRLLFRSHLMMNQDAETRCR
jgi:hypothetical protein